MQPCVGRDNGAWALRIGGIALAVAMVLAMLPGVALASGAPSTDGLLPGGQTVGSGTESATIYRDAAGIPHVYATTLAGMWFGDGWAQAQDRLFQLELTRAAVLGDLSGLFGPGELSTDKAQRLFYYTTAEYAQQYSELTTANKLALSAYADGINAYVDQAYVSSSSEAAMVPVQFWALGEEYGMTGPYPFTPWTPIDTMAIAVYLTRAFGTGGGYELTNLSLLRYLTAYFTKSGATDPATQAMAVFNDARWITDPTAPTTVPRTCADGPVLERPSQSSPHKCLGAGSAGAPHELNAPSTASSANARGANGEGQQLSRLDHAPLTSVVEAATVLRTDENLLLHRGVTLDVLAHGGSNGVAVAPWRSADGHALLWGAPQEGLGTPSVDYEIFLHGPGYDASGMAITGEPFVLIGKNANVAWTTTSEGLTTQGVFIEKVRFTPGPTPEPSTYLFDGRWEPVQVVAESIPVAGTTPQPYTIYRTNNGPIFSTDPSAGTAYSMDFTSWMKEYKSLEGFAGLGADTTLMSFRHSMSEIVTAHNFLYADRQGNIAYFADGLIPSTPSPFTPSYNPQLPHLGTGSEQWDKFVPFTTMPHSVNPGQGYLDNWNTKPAAGIYAQTTGPGQWGTIYRSQTISRMLSASTNISVGYLESVQHSVGTIDNSTTRPAAPYFIPYLESAYQLLEREGSPLVSSATHPDLSAAMSTLAAWAKTFTSGNPPTIGSPAMSIFVNFLHALDRNLFGGGVSPGEQYVGTVNFAEGTLGLGTYRGLTDMTSYNFTYHILAKVSGIVPCTRLCYTGTYFGGHQAQILVESLNDAISILSGTGSQLGHTTVPGFGTTTIGAWGWQPTQNVTWSGRLTPVARAAGITLKSVCGTSAEQNRSTYYIDMDMAPVPFGVELMPPGESGFISATGVPSTHICTQVQMFNDFQYAPFGSSVSGVTPPSGPSRGGTTVTIRGHNLTAASEVYFGTTPSLEIGHESSTTLSAVVPPGSGTVDVRVVTPFEPGGTTPNPYDRFSYSPRHVHA
ncbi:MAG: penicillin acylase family protein [Actinomycetota bacterium]|nr:penicillin acylase family protein [Actinomycetota bacterium]